LGCGTLQIFSQDPRHWRTHVYDDAEFDAFHLERERWGLDPVIVHAPYLPNLGSSNRELYEKSVLHLKDDLRQSERLGAAYLVIHPGAFSPGTDLDTGLRHVSAALNEALAAVPGRTQILIENMAGGGRRLCVPFTEIDRMLDGVAHPDRVGVCFDTCHAFAAGDDFRDPAGAERAIRDFDVAIGLDRLRVFHVNDSRSALSSHRDMHQHLGEGFVGMDGFRALLGGGRFRDRSFILETPRDAVDADEKNLNRLRSFFEPAAAAI
jgi:deoxyribonuclease-4